MIRIFVIIFGLMLPMQIALALTAEERLDDPDLESRARDISAQMRCLVCQNQSIEDSEAGLAKDLRVEIRRLLSQGQNDAEIITAIQQKYGDYVLLNPPMKPETLLLWLSPILILLIGGGILWQHFRQQNTVAPAPVTAVHIADTAPPRTKMIALMFVLVFLLSAGGYSIFTWFGIGNNQQAAQIETQINAMVQGLAERLEEEPDDLAGWQQLAQAYAVLEQTEDAVDALIHIARLMPEDWQAQTFPLELILAQGLSSDYKAQAKELLARLAVLNSERLEYLFFAGHYAKLDGNTDQARAYWQKLYDTLPENSPILEKLRQEINGLDN